MITTGSKFFYGLALLCLFVAVVYGYASGGSHVGPFSAGYLGGVGDVFGYTILLAAAVSSAMLGFVSTAVRDADPEAVVDLAGTDAVLAVEAPRPSYWPVVGAFALGVTLIGLVVSNVLFVAGLIGLGAVAVEWTMQAWSERATGDPDTNRRIRNRIMFPFEIPIGGALVVAFVVGGMSRVFLAVEADAAVWIALAIAAVVFVLGALLSTRPTLRSDLVAGLLVLAALAVLAGGIAGSVSGEREFHHVGDEEESHSEEAE